MADNPDHYMNNVKVVNFDIIYHECRGEPLQKSYKEHKTIEKNDLKNYPENDKKDSLLLVIAVERTYGLNGI